MLWSASFPSASGWLGFVRDPLTIAFFGVNLPQATIGNALLGILIDTPSVVQGSVASAAVLAALVRSDPGMAMAPGVERHGPPAYCPLKIAPRRAR